MVTYATMMQTAAGAAAPSALVVPTGTPQVQPPPSPAQPAASTAVPATPVTNATLPANAPITATAPSSQAQVAPAPTASNAAVGANSTQTASPSGITFPVRPAATVASQAASKPVGHASAADAGSIGGALFSLVLVVGLILVLGKLAKRMPGLQRGAGNAQLKVVASVALGPRDRAVVVDVGGTQLLLGVGQGGVRALHTLDAPLPAIEASNTPSPFAQILAQHFGRKP